MWLNVILLTLASLFVGFVIGMIVAGPRRWDSYVCDDPASHDAQLSESAVRDHAGRDHAVRDPQVHGGAAALHRLTTS